MTVSPSAAGWVHAGLTASVTARRRRRRPLGLLDSESPETDESSEPRASRPSVSSSPSNRVGGARAFESLVVSELLVSAIRDSGHLGVVLSPRKKLSLRSLGNDDPTSAW